MSQQVSTIVSATATKEIRKESARRRTFAVISHPDAGKSTLTEALALHARVIGTAGATNGKENRRETVSDWMQMEKDRGISISSTALQFAYRDTVINLLDTPGHADFSEDTYRVLAAVDCAVMLVDAAKGLETQTMKLFEVCRARNLPIIPVINKWDRPGLDPLALMDEITERTGLAPMPLTWPSALPATSAASGTCRRTNTSTSNGRTPVPRWPRRNTSPRNRHWSARAGSGPTPSTRPNW